MNSTDKKGRGSLYGTNHSQSVIKIKKINKKIKTKKNLKINKSKSKKKLKVKNARHKKNQKSPFSTLLKKGGVEIIKLASIDEIFTRKSIGKDSNLSQGEKTDPQKMKKDLTVAQGNDFLSFIEEKEKNLAQFKETRKYGSASTLAG